jgi:hypothetical protein
MNNAMNNGMNNAMNGAMNGGNAFNAGNALEDYP